jgi:hypothetical protein
MALSTNPATLYHPKRPEFSTTLLWKPRYTVKGLGRGSSVVILSGSWKYEYFTAKRRFSVTIYLPHFVSVYQGNFSSQTFVNRERVALYRDLTLHIHGNWQIFSALNCPKFYSFF